MGYVRLGYVRLGYVRLGYVRSIRDPGDKLSRVPVVVDELSGGQLSWTSCQGASCQGTN